MKLLLLGPLEVRDDEDVVTDLAPRLQKILAVLGLHDGHFVLYDALVDALWPENPPQTARQQVQNGVGVLRQRLRAAGLTDTSLAAAASGITLTTGSIEIDVVRMDRYVSASRASSDPRRSHKQLRRALALWRGPSLAGLTGPMLETAARRLDERRMTLVEDHLDLEVRLGGGDSTLGEIRALIAAYPWRERLVGLLMRQLHTVGRRAEALEVYQAYRRRIRDELGLEPGRALAEMERGILCDDLDIADAPRGEAVPAGVPGWRSR